MCLPVSFFSSCFSFIQFHKVQLVPVKPLGHSRRSSWRWADAHGHYLDALFCEVAVFKSGCSNLPVVSAFELTSVGGWEIMLIEIQQECTQWRVLTCSLTEVALLLCYTNHTSSTQPAKYTDCKYTTSGPKIQRRYLH